MIICKHVTAGYGKQPVLQDITLSFRPGEVMAVIGPNGCGKSTLLRTALGLLKPMSGEVCYDEVPIDRLSVREVARKAAFLTQSRDTPNIPAEKLVLHGRFPWLGFPRQYGKRDREIAKAAMESTNCLGLAEKMLPELSGGQRQEVYLAMTIAQTTKTLFMDEPTTYLDICNQLQLLQSARKAADEGKAVVMVLHDIPQALLFADRIALLQNGRLVLCDVPEKVAASGKIEEGFSVRLTSIETPEGVRYLCGL